MGSNPGGYNPAESARMPEKKRKGTVSADRRMDEMLRLELPNLATDTPVRNTFARIDSNTKTMRQDQASLTVS
jgi:hypothetical protein